MAILIPNINKHETCIECEFFQEGQCSVTGETMWDDNYLSNLHIFKNCPVIGVGVDVDLFIFIQTAITTFGLTYKEFVEATDVVIKKRKQGDD